MSDHPSFITRLVLFFVAPLKILFSGEYAARLTRPALPAPPEVEPEPAAPEPEPTPKIEAARPDAALQLLSVLQREGRLIDFLHEAVDDFDDAEIGAAARVVHAGCKRALEEHFELEPIFDQDEDSNVKVKAGFNPLSVRLTGDVRGEAPFEGTLKHKGWRITEVNLPSLVEDHDTSIVAPAEVELG